jgi:hypothetical protein
LRFRTDVKQIKAPDISWNARFLGIVTKNPDTTTLGELAILVIEIF